MEVLRRISRGGSAGAGDLLTSKDEEFDKVLGLELGADDYLCKPFSLRELQARARLPPPVGGIARRGSRPFSSSGPRLGVGGNRTRFPIASRPGPRARPCGFTVTEFRVLAAMVAAPGIVKSRDGPRRRGLSRGDLPERPRHRLPRKAPATQDSGSRKATRR